MKNKAFIFTICIILAGLVWYEANNHKKTTGEASTSSPEASVTPEIVLSRLSSLKCPEAYKTEDEKTKALLSFFNDYVESYPAAKGDITAFMTGRTDFLIERNCISTLMNFGYDGHSPIDAKIRQDLITAMVNNASSQNGQ